MTSLPCLPQVFCEAKRTSPSILYIPHIQQWWDTVGLALKATFLSLLQDIPSFSPIMLLATSNVAHHDLADEVGLTWASPNIHHKYCREVVCVPYWATQPILF